MIKKAHIVLLLLMSMLWVSCTEVRDPCLQPKNVSLQFGIYAAADTGSAGKVYDLPKAVVGWVDTNEVYYNGQKGNKFAINLSIIADSCRWFIWPDSAATTPIDTVTFYYERKVEFLSTACGYIFTFNLTNVNTTNYNIDSIRVENGNVNTDASTEHLKIFY